MFLPHYSSNYFRQLFPAIISLIISLIPVIMSLIISRNYFPNFSCNYFPS